MQRLDVRTVAAGRWRGILLNIGVDERALTGRHGPCPMCGGKDRFRFDDKEGRGTYYCSGCGAGDGLKLAMGVTGATFREMATRIERMVGQLPASVSKATECSDDDKVAALRRVWAGARPVEQGDETMCYLAGRGLRLATLPAGLRSHHGLSYRDGDTVGAYPAMLALVTGADGRARSIHRTYLQNGRKAPVATPKKLMQGLPISGAAIRLAPVSECMGIAEGIETALAAAQLFGLPVWSCISAAGIESFEPPVGVKEVVIFADHDRNFTGQKAAYAAAHRLTLKGFYAEVQIPPRPGDWLDEQNCTAT